ncbi:recombinase family protein [Terriglobus sp. TAA 43]|uniref:recombinase family protein n=1 Tax=Terriglobus sp. TAA 43 TaxID=278961 RepID=UPI000645818A|nr:recombinase family protein [Terriglobus sp. TAA 43]
MPDTKTVRCAVYTRKSSEEGLDQTFNSLHAQREACEAYILSQKHEGWEVTRTEYDDGGFSGGNMERPGLAKLLSDIAAKRIDTVVVYKVDRLTRSLADFAKIVEQFDREGVSFVSVTQQFNTTNSMGRLTLNVLLSFAQFEREVTGERIRDKIAASKKKGMWMGGVVPLGYDLHDRRLIVQEEEAARVRQIFNLYLELGCVTKLQGRLDELGIRSKKRLSRKGRSSGDAAFSRGALYELLKNRIYLGEIRHKDKCYPGQHEAIVDQAVWDDVQTLLVTNRPSDNTHESDGEVSLLTGRLFDAAGNRFTPSHTTKRGRRYRYYVSQAIIHGNKGKGGSMYRLPAGRIESIVCDGVTNLIGNPQRLIAIIADRPSDPAEMNAILRSSERYKRQPLGTPNIADCVRRVVIDERHVRMFICKKNVRKILGLSCDSHIDAEIEIQLPAVPMRIGGELRFKIEGDSERSRREVPALVAAVVRAREWLDRLMSGDVSSQRDLAAKEGLDERYVSRLLPLAFLSPEITEEILEGTQPPHWCLDTFLGNVPLDWQAQRKAFA